MVYSCSGAEQEYTMVWFGILLYFLIFSLKIRFCEQSVFAKSPLPPSYVVGWTFNFFSKCPLRNTLVLVVAQYSAKQCLSAITMANWLRYLH